MKKKIYTKKIYEVYEPDTVTIRTAQRWFDRFRSGVVDVEDTPRTGRPIVEIIQVDRHVNIPSIGQEQDSKKCWMFGCHMNWRKKSLGPNQRLQCTAETERIRPIFEADGDW